MKKQQICILGSTGSIGTQTLKVVENNADRFQIHSLTANTNVDLLAKQAAKYNPDSVVIADERYYDKLKSLMFNLPNIKVYAGKQALIDIVQAQDIDVVVASMVGFAGLPPTIQAIKARKKICLANKETLVVAGELICNLAKEYKTPILPVDSEHSAIFQCLVGENDNEIEKILLTASGGPFRKLNNNELQNVTAQMALQHPTWSMGDKITIDSATLMNKGFEMIEACWLFGVPADKIEILIHPQSIIHSAVQFKDGAIKAQLGVPDMGLPIQYALTYPERLPMTDNKLNMFKSDLQFFEPDFNKFPCLQLAFDAMKKGGNSPCVMNAANEIANKAFRDGVCSYKQIAETIHNTMNVIPFEKEVTFENCVQFNEIARKAATEYIKKITL